MYTSMFAGDLPEVVQRMAETPAMRRLAGIGMHCGCDYADLPLYRNVRCGYSRLMHSVGVAKIVWHFTRDVRQAAAGLLHDVATPAFAHTIDFMNGDHMAQESTESETALFIQRSPEIMGLLHAHGIRMEEVCDYHQYPIADNDTPMLSADRLEYTLGDAYILYHESLEDIRGLYEDLTIAVNEIGQQELCFRSLKMAKRFTEMSLRNSYLFVCDEERYVMERLADIVRSAIRSGALAPEDLYTTEEAVVEKMEQDASIRDMWREFRSVSAVERAQHKRADRYCVNVAAKRRYIDPLVSLGNGGCARISTLDAGAADGIGGFLRMDFDAWLYAL